MTLIPSWRKLTILPPGFTFSGAETHIEGAIGDKPTAFFDIFRIENGKIAEHWDVLQEVPAEAKNRNGMF